MNAATPTTSVSRTYSKLHIGLWAVQILLGLFFAMTGFMKLTQPIDVLAVNMVWAGSVPSALVRFIGAAELLGGLGLILPSAARVLPVLTPVAALGLATIMALAAVFHIGRGEVPMLPLNLVIGTLPGSWPGAD